MQIYLYILAYTFRKSEWKDKPKINNKWKTTEGRKAREDKGGF